MSKKAVFIGGLNIIFLIITNFCFASFPHAPHDAANSIGCADCHNTKLSDTNRSQICESCHITTNPNFPNAPIKKTHSDFVISNGTSTLWETVCLDCHDPHFQNQIINYNTQNFFIVTGTISSVNPDSPAGFSTLTYSASLIQSGWNLPPHTDNADWGAKTGPGRGLILMAGTDDQDANFFKFSYEIDTADSTTITVKGNADPALAGQPFGIIYGQLLRSTVAGRPVVFTGPTTFADNDGLAGGDDSTPNGICQVCHLPKTPQNPTHWLSDGTLAQNHFGGTDCMACHDRIEGFRPSGADHVGTRYITTFPSCIVTGCHDSAADDPLVNTHKSECSLCHTNPGAGDYSLKAGSSAFGHRVPEDGPENTCATCHTDIAADWYQHNIDHENTNRVTSHLDCVACHNLTPFIDPADTTKHNGCDTCHAPDGSLISLATNGPGDCTNCHGQYDHALDHNNLQATTSCAICHTNKITGTDFTYIHSKHPPLSTLGGTPLQRCQTCHESTRTEVVNTIAAGKGPTGSQVDCEGCHTDRALHPQIGNPAIMHYVIFITGTGAGGCGACHIANNDTHLDMTTSPSCSVSGCHASANQDEINALHQNDCRICHLSTRTGVIDNIVAGIAGSTVNCETCHGPDSEAAHHGGTQAQSGNCTWCHADPRPGWPGTAPDPIPAQLFCIKCHIEPSGTGLVVYRNTYTPVPVSSFPNGDRNWPINGDAAVQQTPVHTITGASKINVQNYGACLGCHDGNTPNAPQIQIWHAKPTWNKNTHDTASSKYDNTFDVLRNAPGRSYFANNNTPPNGNGADDATADERRFNIFADGINTGSVEKLRIIGRYQFGNASIDQPYDDDSTSSSQERGKHLYKDYQGANGNNGNPWTNSVWSNRLQIPRNSFNNSQGLLSSDPFVPLP